MYEQVCGRLARRGQVAKEITVHTALCRDTVDEQVFDVLTGKRAGMKSFLGRMYDLQST